jgi:hypothetical protein
VSSFENFNKNKAIEKARYLFNKLLNEDYRIAQRASSGKSASMPYIKSMIKVGNAKQLAHDLQLALDKKSRCQ